MGICTRRSLLMTLCTLQLISTIERQVFDFLGFMWAPILANFFHIIFVIFGFFGVFQYRPKYIITYAVWSIIWTGWNVFIICFYLDVGILDRNSDLLNMGTGSVSWWEVNGAGCKPIYPTNLTAEDPYPYRPLRPERVTGCVLEYEYIEVMHAAFHCVLAVLGALSGISVSKTFLEEDDSFQANNHNKKKNKRTSLYSIEFSPHNNCGVNDSIDFDDDNGLNGTSQLTAPQLSPRPMTPRRVKRRSVISRGSTSRNSLSQSHHITDKRNSIRHSTTHSSLRASARRSKIQHPNPVTRLIEQQQNLQHNQTFGESTTSNDSHILNVFDPSSSQADLLVNSCSNGQWKRTVGHTNPLYQQNSSQSLNEEDDTYNNRPSSARSSYSNYHGTRPISCYVSRGGTPYYMPGQATPQVPLPSSHRHSSHAIQKSKPNPGFFNNGPPAYQVQGVIDSETVI